MGISGMVIQEDDIDFGLYMQQSDAGHKVKPAKAWRDELVDEVNGVATWNNGTMLPWDKTKGLFKFRQGEVTLWFGFNGSGKSLINGNALLSQAAQGEVCLICSFEMKPRRTLARMLRQWVGRPMTQISPAEVDAFLDWCEGRIFVYDQTGTADWHKVVAVTRWAAANKACTVVAIDNLMKCVKNEDDYNGQKEFTDQLTTVARELNIHIHLIHHPKKADDETKPPRKMDSHGGGAVINMVDNVLIIWKNKPKMEAKERNDPSKDAEPDAILICDKQRNGEWEGKIPLWFHYMSQQFVERTTSQALDFSRPEFPHFSLSSHGYKV